mmetsp:Transcript_44218/g.122405  ORF Transcript_44218/g.122405 Transcript_44218/m.122405 type:complete len:337 (-) Transcript_44218:34-1044(-)
MAWRSKPYQGGYYHGGGKGGKKGGGRGNGRRGEFTWASAAPLDVDPEVLPRATYSYAAKSSDIVDVMTPAWTVRRLLTLPDPVVIDLSLERCLCPLQGANGGFDITTDFLAALGWEDTPGALALADEPDAQAFGAVLALKAVNVYKGEKLSAALAAMCEAAGSFVFKRLRLKSAELKKALCDVTADAPGSASAFPAKLAEALRSNFAPSSRWSFFDLWARLLPAGTMKALREEGGFLCPRFFLVDLASATQSPYDIDKQYPLVRHGACVFVGQPASDDGGGRDAMRQGHCPRAATMPTSGRATPSQKCSQRTLASTIHAGSGARSTPPSPPARMSK